MITINSIRSDVKIPVYNTLQWKESLTSYKKEISSLFGQLGKLKIRLLDVNTQNQLCHFSDLLQMYDEQLHNLMIDLFLTEQGVEKEESSTDGLNLELIQKSLRSLIDKLKAFEDCFLQLKSDFTLFWEQHVFPSAVRVN